MKTRWHRAAGSLFDRGDAREGTLSVFWDYNLMNWFFGFSFDIDDCWYDLNIGAGPVGLSFTYWRRHVYLLGH